MEQSRRYQRASQKSSKTIDWKVHRTKCDFIRTNQVENFEEQLRLARSEVDGIVERAEVECPRDKRNEKKAEYPEHPAESR